MIAEPIKQTSDNEFMVACEECGLVVNIPELSCGQKGSCPRCDHTVIKQIRLPYHRVVAYGIACLIMLVLSVSFPFMSFSVNGMGQEITLLNTAETLQHFENSALAILLMLTVLILPALYILLMLYLYYHAANAKHLGHSINRPKAVKYLCRVLFKIQPWLMVDVFLIGVLISLVKISALADIGLGNSFWAFCIYSFLVVKCVSLVDRTWLWQQFFPMQPIQGVDVGDSHLSNNHVACHMCNQLNPMPTANHGKCLRCESHLHPYNPQDSLQYAWAYLLVSIVFYIPANLYPMMYTVSLGESDGSTIIGGVILLWEMGSWPIAMVIFIASVLIPVSKMCTLVYLYYSARKRSNDSSYVAIKRMRLYRVTEFIGRWSMIDIFVVAILVALVQLHNLMSISPGPAAICFAFVVIFTMLSAMSFDPRLFWVAKGKSKQASELNSIQQ
ncbi:paraquat-inducible protein A [Shewanella violacea DSS12]|uniref:Paraquat-inducible protein A n=1 Tax=Shewanella violacea (strain JCM 10179 / CIP 106290 / LMG 19151 / DSS12) TaxID=637905 RepID=D4ZEI9_SHEVD|nr:paraquat-inducible protein A [Shewanella violacea DSS12]